MSRRPYVLLVIALTACGRVGYTDGTFTGGDAEMDADAGMDAARDAVTSSSPVCGDGVVEGEEICDDGDSQNGDGCDNDCTFSCTADAECVDAEVCDGDEVCGAENACEAGDPLSDGTACSEGRVCRSGSCAPVTCGDGVTDPDEECDDGNTIDGDGCDTDCGFSCTVDSECDEGDSCTREACTPTNTCEHVATAADGTACDRDGMSTTVDLCLGGTCHRSLCGDGWVDASLGEDCDDGNTVDGDGCDADCSFSCSDDVECSDGQVCNGLETCDPSSHVCRRGAPARDGTACGVSGTCVGGTCIMIAIPDGGATDTGPDTDAGACPEPPTSTMPLRCFKNCSVDADCIYANVAGSCCCGCAMGGMSEAINGATAGAWSIREGCFGASCGGVMCLSIYLCGGPAMCVDGQCTGGSPSS